LNISIYNFLPDLCHRLLKRHPKVPLETMRLGFPAVLAAEGAVGVRIDLVSPPVSVVDMGVRGGVAVTVKDVA